MRHACKGLLLLALLIPLLLTPMGYSRPNSQDLSQGLIFAAGRGDTAIVQALIDAGADVNATEMNNGRTALMAAAVEGHTATVQTLLDAGADVSAKSNGGGRALVWAAANGHTATVQTLLEAGADVSAKDYSGWTALVWAAANGHTATVQTLLEAGADVNAKDYSGWTALMWTAHAGHTATVQALIDAGADVNATEMNSGWTVLMWAAHAGHTDTVRALIERGADVHVTDMDGLTALTKAQGFRQTEVVEILKKAGADESTQATAQENLWETFIKAGMDAYRQGNYAEAEKQFIAAHEEAENFGSKDLRLATSLNNLAELYDDQGKYAKAEPLYQRSLAIWEKTLGPEHPNVATSLENYATLLRKLKPIRSLLPWSEASSTETRAKAIREKHGQ